MLSHFTGAAGPMSSRGESIMPNEAEGFICNNVLYDAAYVSG